MIAHSIVFTALGRSSSAVNTIAIIVGHVFYVPVPSGAQGVASIVAHVAPRLRFLLLDTVRPLTNPQGEPDIALDVWVTKAQEGLKGERGLRSLLLLHNSDAQSSVRATRRMRFTESPYSLSSVTFRMNLFSTIGSPSSERTAEIHREVGNRRTSTTNSPT